MTWEQAVTLGQIDSDSVATSDPVYPWHLRQVAIQCNGLVQTPITVASEAAVWPDLATVGARANDTKANFYDYAKTNWNVATPEWSEWHPPVHIMYPPGSHQLIFGFYVAVHTDAILDLQFTSSAHGDRSPYQLPSLSLGTLQGPDTAASFKSGTFEVDPSGADTIRFWHRVKKKGSEYTSATTGAGNLNSVQNSDEWFTSSWDIDVANINSIDGTVSVRAPNSTYRGQNPLDCGALIEICDSSSVPILPLKQVVAQKSTIELTLNSFTEQEQNKIPDQCNVIMYRTAIWSNLGWYFTVNPTSFYV